MTHPLDDVTPLQWTPARFSDCAEIARLMGAIYYIDEPAERWTLEEIEDTFARSGKTVCDMVAIGWDRDSAVAMIWNNFVDYPGRVRLAGGVHPAYRHQGLGRRMFTHQREAAIAWWRANGHTEPLSMMAFADAKLAGKRGLYERAGMREGRWFIDMHCLFRDMGAEVDRSLQLETPGVRLVPYDVAYAESARQCHNEAFGSSWGSPPITETEWSESLTRVSARPEWSWLALATEAADGVEVDEVVGYAFNSTGSSEEVLYDEVLEGWTDRLGVRPSWRGRGIARAVLAHSLDSFRAAGMEGGGLGVDSQRGAGMELYRSLGYQATDTIIEYEWLEPGCAETGEQTAGREPETTEFETTGKGGR